MARLSKVAAFILGPNTKDDEDEFESEAIDSSADEPTDIVETDAKASPRVHAVSSRANTVTPLETRRHQTPPRQVAMNEIHHVRPYSFAEAAEIGENFKDGVTVVLNFSATDEKQAQKLIDFASGMAYVTDGKLEKITPRVFLLIPASVQLTASDREQLLEDQTGSE